MPDTSTWSWNPALQKWVDSRTGMQMDRLQYSMYQGGIGQAPIGSAGPSPIPGIGIGSGVSFGGGTDRGGQLPGGGNLGGISFGGGTPSPPPFGPAPIGGGTTPAPTPPSQSGGGNDVLAALLKGLGGGGGGWKAMLPMLLAQGGFGLLSALLSRGNEETPRASFEGTGATDPKLTMLNLVRALYQAGNAAGAHAAKPPQITAQVPKLTNPLAAGWAVDSVPKYEGVSGLENLFPSLGTAPGGAGAVPRPPGSPVPASSEALSVAPPKKRRIGT